MTIPYRVRRGLQRFFITLCVLVLLAVLVLGLWLLWLSRYVIYTEEGAKFDFGLSMSHPQGQLATPPSAHPTVPISYGDSDELPGKTDAQLQKLAGYTVSAEMLKENLSAVRTTLSALPEGTPVLLDLKTIKGEFLYTTSLGRKAEGVDTAAVTQIIRDLEARGCYLIARLPAFRDYWYFLDDEATRVPYGLPKIGGNGSLWLDGSGPSYWFNPASTGSLNYLVQIATELRSMGFDEVVFSDFCFPDTNQIQFEGDRTATLNQAAATLVQACGTESFTLSFTGSHIKLPQGKCRLYLANFAAVDIGPMVSQLQLPNPAAQLVFITDLMDTRYDQYGVLRPLELPQN